MCGWGSLNDRAIIEKVDPICRSCRARFHNHFIVIVFPSVSFLKNGFIIRCRSKRQPAQLNRSSSHSWMAHNQTFKCFSSRLKAMWESKTKQPRHWLKRKRGLNGHLNALWRFTSPNHGAKRCAFDLLGGVAGSGRTRGLWHATVK